MDRWLRSNTVVKIIAFLLALMLWLVLNIDENPKPAPTNGINSNIESTTLKDMEVNMRYDDSKYTIVKGPEPVTITLKGKKSLLNQVKLMPNTYEVFVDVSNLPSGRQQVKVQHTGFPLDLDVKVIPENVEVTIEKQITINKWVSVNLLGNPKEGYEVGDAQVSPGKVKITLPVEQAENVLAVQVSVDIKDIDKTIKRKVELQVIDEKGQTIDAGIEPQKVAVTVPITRLSKTVPLHLKMVGQVPEGLALQSIEVTPNQVEIYGSKKALQGIKQYGGPTLNLSQLGSSEQLQLDIPVHSQVQEIKPNKANVDVQIVSSETKEFLKVPIQMEGKSKNTQVKMLSPENGIIHLEVEGAPSRIDELSEKDIHAYINVDHLSEGENEQLIQIDLPPYIKVVGELPHATFEIHQGGNPSENPN